MASVFVQWLHAHIGLITCDVVLMNFFFDNQKITSNLSWLKNIKLHAYKYKGFLKISPNLQY